MIQIQSKTRGAGSNNVNLDNYVKLMKTVNECVNEGGKNKSPADMQPIKMSNYEINFGKFARKAGGRKMRNNLALNTLDGK